MNLMVLADTTVGVSVGPFEGFGALVVGLDIAGDLRARSAREVKTPRVIRSR
jgi:hypothetical protein